MKTIEYDTAQSGFQSVLKSWQLIALQVVWSAPEGLNTRSVHQKVNEKLEGDSISRASIINFLEDMREMKILSGIDRTGKGGHQWVYMTKMDEAAFKRFIVEKLLSSMMESFPIRHGK